MSRDTLEAFEGLRTIQYFTFLLVLVVMLYVLGAVLSVTHDITILERFFGCFVNDPMILLPIAGIIALAVLGLKMASVADSKL